MKFRLLDRYVLDQVDDTVSWFRIFDHELKLMSGKGVYRDDVLVLLFPSEVSDITDLPGVRKELQIDELPEWNKTQYVIHMGNARQGYPVQEAIAVSNGRLLEEDEIFSLVDRIEGVF